VRWRTRAARAALSARATRTRTHVRVR
jgi:hypothetical protein